MGKGMSLPTLSEIAGGDAVSIPCSLSQMGQHEMGENQFTGVPVIWFEPLILLTRQEGRLNRRFGLAIEPANANEIIDHGH